MSAEYTPAVSRALEAAQEFARLAGATSVQAEHLLQALVRDIPVAEPVLDYAARMVMATHPENGQAPAVSRRYVRYGASPRAIQTLILAGKVNGGSPAGGWTSQILSKQGASAIGVVDLDGDQASDVVAVGPEGFQVFMNRAKVLQVPPRRIPVHQIGEGINPRVQLPLLSWLYLADAVLAPLGLLIAAPLNADQAGDVAS